jgi:ABC-type uncharacterized transport system ATPase subunit
LLITHKFREVTAFCDTVSVLRRGRHVGTLSAADVEVDRIAEMMVGEAPPAPNLTRSIVASQPARLVIDRLKVRGDKGTLAVRSVSLSIRPGEIVGIAGVSGNGQRELVEALSGQRAIVDGSVTIAGETYHATREEMRRHRLYSLPEEPLKNACVPSMSVAANMALRNFDIAPLARGPWLRNVQRDVQATAYVSAFNVKCAGIDARIDTLSGGNVQRAVLARELSREVEVLIVTNPVFGLDFAAVAETWSRLMAVRNGGTALLLISEDIDELLTLADRIVVMSEGELVYEVPRVEFNLNVIGRYMAGYAEAATH